MSRLNPCRSWLSQVARWQVLASLALMVCVPGCTPGGGDVTQSSSRGASPNGDGESQAKESRTEANTKQGRCEDAQTLTMQWREAWNRHSDLGATSRRVDATVTMTLCPDGVVRVRDEGSDADSITNDYNATETKVSWANTWTGTWEATNEGGSEALALSLTLVNRMCEQVVTDLRDRHDEQPCADLEAAVQVECVVEEIDVQPADARINVPAKPMDAWICRAQRSALGGTKLPWVMGKAGCVEIGGGPGRRKMYRQCSRD